MHKIKILPEYFEAVLTGRKRFELRKNDRNYKIGDKIELAEWEEGDYTGRSLTFVITYILEGCPEYGLKEGYCILGF